MKKPSSVISLAALAAVSILSGCAGGAKQAAAPAPPAAVPVAQEPAAQDRPGKAAAGLVVVTATVTAVSMKNRTVTLRYPDGKTARVKVGPEARNFGQIRVGDEVRAEFLESVELFVADAPETPAAERSAKLARAPLGAKPGVAAVSSVEVRATVQAIDYQTREVILQGPEGKILKVKAGPEVKRLAEVKAGDTVVARLTKAVSITVTAPAPAKK